MGTRVWWLAALGVALVASLAVVVQQVHASKLSAVPVRPQSARESFIMAGHGTPTPPSENELQDLMTAARGTGQSEADVIAANAGLDEFHAATDRLSSGFVLAGHASPEADYRYWVLFSSKPTANELAPLMNLPVDVEVRYGDTIGTSQEEALGGRTMGLLQGRLPVVAVESSFNDDYDAVVVSYRPPRGSTDADLDAAEHAVLQDLAADQPDHRLPFPVSFVRDPSMTVSGFAQ